MPKPSTPPDKRRLPEANEFSPGQVELRRVLDIVLAHEHDRPSIVEAIRREYFTKSALKHSDPNKRMKIQNTRANNVLIGMSGYGLLDLETSSLTPAGRELAALHPEKELYRAFAHHILTRCNGLTVLQAVRSLQVRRERPTKESLQRELEREGFKLPRATTHHTKLLNWLEKAGVVDGYEINDDVVASLLGVTTGTTEEWATLPPQQLSFLKTLRRRADVTGKEPQPVQALLDQVVFEHGPVFRPDQVRAKVIEPLVTAGWISAPPKGEGRGGKSGTVAPTDKLLAVDLEILAGLAESGIPADLRSKLNTPLEEIYSDIQLSGDSRENNHRRGIALELLAMHIANDLSLQPLKFRERGITTGGAELDLIAEGVHLHFSRWLFQCKNTRLVHLHDLAKEVGMAVLMRAQVIVMVTTGSFSGTVKEYADELARTTPLQVILVDGPLLEKYRKSGSGILMSHFKTEASLMQKLKREQVEREHAQS